MSHQLFQEYNQLHQTGDSTDIDPEVKSLYELTSTPDIGEIDVESAWGRIEEELKVVPISKGTSYTYWLRAAMVVLIVGIGGFFLYDSDVIQAPTAMVEVSAEFARQEVVLPDQSVVMLGIGSTLSYEEDFSSGRQVTLTGEAFFDVEKGLSNFTITSGSTTIEVLGTSFNVNARSKEKTEVIVTEGLVSFSAGSKEAKIAAGDKGTFYVQQDAMIVEEQDDINALAWKTGKFVFDNTRLADVARYLNTYYESKVQIRGRVAECQVTASFDKMPLSQILEELTLVLSVKVKKSGKTYILTGEGC